MAKDKTQPRADLAARREAQQRAAREAAAKRRRRLIINWLIALIIVGLAAGGVVGVVAHVRSEARKLSVSGPASVQPQTPPNATSDGLAVLANPGVTIPADAPVVDLYLDYQNSLSVQVMQFYGAAFSDLASQGKIELRYHFMTGQDQTLGNTASARATIATICADTVGKFVPYSQAVFTAAPLNAASGAVTFTDTQLQTTFPATAGITGDDLTKFRSCYAGRATSAFVVTMNTKNQTTPVPTNTTYTAGVSTTPVVLADSKTVDITSDLYSQTVSTADPAALLTLLTNAANGTTTS